MELKELLDKLTDTKLSCFEIRRKATAEKDLETALHMVKIERLCGELSVAISQYVYPAVHVRKSKMSAYPVPMSEAVALTEDEQKSLLEFNESAFCAKFPTEAK